MKKRLFFVSFLLISVCASASCCKRNTVREPREPVDTEYQKSIVSLPLRILDNLFRKTDIGYVRVIDRRDFRRFILVSYTLGCPSACSNWKMTVRRDLSKDEENFFKTDDPIAVKIDEIIQMFPISCLPNTDFEDILMGRTPGVIIKRKRTGIRDEIYFSTDWTDEEINRRIQEEFGRDALNH